jgi:hypothetical protein
MWRMAGLGWPDSGLWRTMARGTERLGAESQRTVARGTERLGAESQRTMERGVTARAGAGSASTEDVAQRGLEVGVAKGIAELSQARG